MISLGGMKGYLGEQLRLTEERLGTSVDLGDQLKIQIINHLKDIEILKTALKNNEVKDCFVFWCFCVLFSCYLTILFTKIGIHGVRG